VTEVVELSVPEVLVAQTVGTTVVHGADTTVIDTAAVVTVIEAETETVVTESVPDTTVIIDAAPVEVITDVQTYTLVVLEPDVQLIETAEQGPPGPRAGSYPGKTLVWAQGNLSEVLLYDDAAKTQLAERRILNRTGGTLTSIDFFDGDGALVKTRTLGYSSGVLTSVMEA
jgi:hypothetical protein